MGYVVYDTVTTRVVKSKAGRSSFAAAAAAKAAVTRAAKAAVTRAAKAAVTTPNYCSSEAYWTA